MIKRIFITLCLLTLAVTSARADDASIKISLGILNSIVDRDIPLPLAFRIQNTGTNVIGIGQARNLYFSGRIFVSSKDVKVESADCKRFDYELAESMAFVQNDLHPGDTFENRIIVNLLTIFPLIKDGDYEVWWSVGNMKSNSLRFKVVDGKLEIIKTET
jgi:hypothetical protein